MNGVLYCRISSEEQTHGFSLESQESEGVEYAKKKGITIVKKFKVVESASYEGRQAFNQAIDYLNQHGDTKILLVYKMDRAIRNLGDMSLIDKLAHDNGKEIHFYHEGWNYNKNSSIADFYRFGFMSVVATGFSRNLSDITKVGLRKKAEKGQFPGSAPFGYRNNKDTRLIEIDELEKPWVLRIKQLAATEASLSKISETLQRERCPYKLVTSKLERIIRSTFYIGQFEWDGQVYSGIHKPIIDKGLHDAAVKGFGRLNKPRGRHQIIPYRGLMTCAFCGCAITGERHKGKYVYYRCTWRRGRCENKGYIEQRDLDKQFERILENIQIDEKRAHDLLFELERDSGKEIALRESKVAFLRQEHQRIQKRLEAAYEDKLDGKLEETDWFRKSQEWKGKLLDFENEIKMQENVNPVDSLRTLRRVLELANTLKYQFTSLPEEKRGQVLKYVCQNLRLKQGSILFIYAKPFDLFAETAVSGNWGRWLSKVRTALIEGNVAGNPIYYTF